MEVSAKLRFFDQNIEFYPSVIKLTLVKSKKNLRNCCLNHLTDLTGFPLLSLPLCQSFALNGAKLERKRCQQIQKIVVTRPFAEQHSILLPFWHGIDFYYSPIRSLFLKRFKKSKNCTIDWLLQKKKNIQTNLKLIWCGE